MYGYPSLVRSHRLIFTKARKARLYVRIVGFSACVAIGGVIYAAANFLFR